MTLAEEIEVVTAAMRKQNDEMMDDIVKSHVQASDATAIMRRALKEIAAHNPDNSRLSSAPRLFVWCVEKARSALAEAEAVDG